MGMPSRGVDVSLARKRRDFSWIFAALHNGGGAAKDSSPGLEGNRAMREIVKLIAGFGVGVRAVSAPAAAGAGAPPDSNRRGTAAQAIG